MKQQRKKGAPLRGKALALALGAAGLLCTGVSTADARQSAPGASTNTVAAAASGTNSVPIPLAHVAPESEAAFTSLRAIEENLTSDPTTATIQEELPILTQDSSVRLEETSRLLSSNPSLETLGRLDREWQALSEELAEWKRSLSKRAAQLEEDRGHLAQMEGAWTAMQIAGPGLNMPPELLERVKRVIAAVKRTREKADAQQTAVLTLQARVSEQDGRARHALASIERAHEAFIRRLLVRDSPPIWSKELWSESTQNLVEQSNHSLSRQVQALSGYMQRRGEPKVFLQVIVFLALCFGLIVAGRRWRRLGGREQAQTALVFEAPVLSALVLALLASSWIYPQAPRLLSAILGVAALIPTVLLARKLLDRRLFPVLNALVVFNFVDQLRIIAASQAVLSRVLFLAEMLGGVLFVAGLLGGDLFRTAAEPERFRKRLRMAGRVALGIFALAFLLSALGYVTLSNLLGHALLQSAYIALVLYAVVRIVDALLLSAMSVPPLSRLGVVSRHRALLQSRALAVLEWTAIVCWVFYALETLALRAPVFQDLKEVLTARWGVGAFKVSLGDIALFGLTVWAAFLISRVVRFVLDEEVYPRVNLAPGLHYSISKMVNYAILVIGFLIGVAMLGLDLTKLTILVGAFGVGLGFGLQNIINNFVSGLILLFERPIKVGDVVQLSGNEGVVQHIGIRASIVRVANGSEIIVPNGSLISETVINWTFSDQLRRVDVPLAVAGPADARQVMELLESVAAQQKLVIKEPPPRALLLNFSGDTLNFELRIWTNQSQDWSQLRSDLEVALRTSLAERKITVK